ncbi:MAG: hypothetical protein M3P15_01945 [Actinomycetota bacterium]|nr:hypothetical protein [Actinomycetota bacterium]
MFGLLAVAAHRSQLDRWGAIWAIVAGVITLLLFLGGVVAWIWQRSRRPVLTIECGDGYDFDKEVGKTDAFVVRAVEEHRSLGAFAKLVRVAETRGKRGARNVVVRMKDVSPPPPHTSSFVELQFANHEEANDIRPHGHKSVVALFAVFYEAKPGEVGWRTTPTVLEHADLPEFTLEIVVDGEPYSEARFVMNNAWSHERIDAMWSIADWPPPGLQWPKIRPLEAS